MKEGNLSLLNAVVNSLPKKLERLKARVGIFEETNDRTRETTAFENEQADKYLPSENREHEAPDELTNSEIGWKHEVGAGRLPMRSFLRMPMEAKAGMSETLAKSQIGETIQDYFTGKSLAEAVVTHLAILGEQTVDRAFETRGFGQWNKLHEDTIAAKGHSAILIDSGQLRQSITHQVV